MLFPMLYWKLNLPLVFIPKHSIFRRRLKNLVALLPSRFVTKQKIFLELFFPAKFLPLDIFRTNNAKRIKFIHDFWRWWLIPSKVTVFAKESILRKISRLKLFWLKSHERIDRFLDALHFSECFIQVWHIDREIQIFQVAKTFVEVLGLWLFLLLRILVQKYV